MRQTPPGPAERARAEHARAAYLRACALDVGVRKPGNVSLASAGHGMHARLFLASAQASAPALFVADAGVGARIEAAIDATWSVAGCNTNLGVVLLCAPVAAAIQHRPEARLPGDIRAAIESVLDGLDRADADAAFRAIVRANPAGLGNVPEQDVHQKAGVDLRAAMRLAAGHDRIALQYAEAYREVFDVGMFGWQARWAFPDEPAIGADLARAVQHCYLRWLGSAPDSHIVRKHGPAAAEQVMQSARRWLGRAEAGASLDDDAGWLRWDAELKARGMNPGSSADLTVVSLMLSILCGVF